MSAPLTRPDLQEWYRGAMRRRATELVALLPRLRASDQDAFDAARSVGMSLRGSGASFGFPRLSELATRVEVSPDADVLRRVEGLVAELEAFVVQGADQQPVCGSWLARAADLPLDSALLSGPSPDASSESCWSAVAREAGIEPDELVRRAAAYFGLEVADLGARTRSALRLVPEALVLSHGIVPLSEDPRTILVATADPASLDTEHELEQLTGRRPVFAVAHPAAISAAQEDLHGASAPARPAPLPSTPAPSPTAAPSASTRPAPPVSSRPDEASILVVDDEASARLLVRSILEKRGYRVVEAVDGLAALDAIGADGEVQLVVADLDMPRMDGLELVWELRDRPASREIPVIVVTGEQDEVLETQLLEEGADDYVRKPIDPRLFLARVEATMRRSVGISAP